MTESTSGITVHLTAAECEAVRFVLDLLPALEAGASEASLIHDLGQAAEDNGSVLRAIARRLLCCASWCQRTDGTHDIECPMSDPYTASSVYGHCETDYPIGHPACDCPPCVEYRSPRCDFVEAECGEKGRVRFEWIDAFGKVTPMLVCPECRDRLNLMHGRTTATSWICDHGGLHATGQRCECTPD